MWYFLSMLIFVYTSSSSLIIPFQKFFFVLFYYCYHLFIYLFIAFILVSKECKFSGRTGWRDSMTVYWAIERYYHGESNWLVSCFQMSFLNALHDIIRASTFLNWYHILLSLPFYQVEICSGCMIKVNLGKTSKTVQVVKRLNIW